MIIGYRIIILLLTTACLSMMMANILTFNFCIICMTAEHYDYREKSTTMDIIKDSSMPNLMAGAIASKIRLTEKLDSVSPKNASLHIDILSINPNGTAVYRQRYLRKAADYKYTSREQSILFAAIAVGALAAIMPISFSIQRCGTRKTFAAVMIISGTSTALCPLAASFGTSWFTFFRILQGIGFASCMPVIGSVTSTWAQLAENGLFNGALTSFIQLGPVITMPMAGFLCSISLGWPSVFYVHAVITWILTVLWWFLYRNVPNDVRYVSAHELQLVTAGKIAAEAKSGTEKLPVCWIFRTLSVWAVWIAAIGNMYSIQMVVVYTPTYISQVLGLPIVNVGLTAALPTLLQFVVKMLAGTASDKITAVSETVKVRLFNSIAFLGMGSFLVALAYTPTARTNLALLFLICSATVLGFNTGGFFKSCTLIGRQYSYFINTIVQVIMCIAMLTVPFIVTTLTPNGLAEEWYYVFVLHAAILFITNAIFCRLGKSTAAPFTCSSTVAGAAEIGSLPGEPLKPVLL